MDILPTKPQFSLQFVFRLVLYCALCALCIRLYWQTRPERRAARFLQAADSWTNSSVQELLADMGPHAVPFLLAELDHADANRVVRAMEALPLLPKDADRTVPAIMGKLEHPDSKVRRTAARSLGIISIGRDDDEVLSALVEAIYDPDKWVWSETTESLYVLAITQERRSITSRADEDDSNPYTRAKLCEALGSLGSAAARGEPWLVDTLDDKNGHVRWSAAIALTKIGTRDDRVTARLVRMYRERDQLAEQFRGRLADFLSGHGVDLSERTGTEIDNRRNADCYASSLPTL